MIKLTKNPIFRVCGIVVILYYGLFQNKHEPDSLGNRLAPERIKSNLSEISEKSVYIISNVKKLEDTQKPTVKDDTKADDKKEKEEKGVKDEQK